MGTEEALAHESKIYGQFSHFYDRIFSNVFYPRIERVLQDIDFPPAADVLEVGIGTGLAIPAYPADCNLTGVDLAPDMLERARARADELGRHVELAVGDAQDLDFDDSSFDVVTSFHVVSVVPDPQAMMREICRVCRPGGTIVVINHFRSDRAVISSVVDRLDPITRKLGWSTRLGVEDLLEDVPFELVSLFKTSPQSLFTVLIGRRPVEPLRAGVMA